MLQLKVPADTNQCDLRPCITGSCARALQRLAEPADFPSQPEVPVYLISMSLAVESNLTEVVMSGCEASSQYDWWHYSCIFALDLNPDWTWATYNEGVGSWIKVCQHQGGWCWIKTRLG